MSSYKANGLCCSITAPFIGKCNCRNFDVGIIIGPNLGSANNFGNDLESIATEVLTALCNYLILFNKLMLCNDFFFHMFLQF